MSAAANGAKPNELIMSIFGNDYEINHFNSAIEKFTTDNGFSMRFTRYVKLVFEEVVSLNLVPYSEAYYNIYPISIDALYSAAEETVKINFRYSGMNYDPIEGIDDLSAAIVKKIAEDVQYSYVDGVNYLYVLLKKE